MKRLGVTHRKARAGRASCNCSIRALPPDARERSWRSPGSRVRGPNGEQKHRRRKNLVAGVAAKTMIPRLRQVPMTGLSELSGWVRRPGTRDPRAHQNWFEDEQRGGLAFCMAGTNNTVPAETIPVVFDRPQARTAHGHADADGLSEFPRRCGRDCLQRRTMALALLA